MDYHSEYLLDLINPNHWEIPAHSGKFELKPIPSTDDYTFIKWVKYMFGPSYDPEQAEPVTYIDTDVVREYNLMPIIHYKTYTISHYADNALLRSKDITYETRYKDNLSGVLQSKYAYTCPKKDYYTEKWDIDNDALLQRIKTKLENIDVHAVYTSIDYPLSFSSNIDGVAPDAMTYQHGVTIKDIYDHCNADGYTLRGIYSDPNFENKLDDDHVIEEKTLYVAYGQTHHLQTLAQIKALDPNSFDTYILDNDINCNGESIFNLGNFKGVFDGGNHKIYNASYSNSETDQTYGLFSQNQGVIKNLVFDDISWIVGNAPNNANADIGFLTGVNNGTIENIHILSSGFKLKNSTKSYDYDIRTELGIFSGRNNGMISNCSIDDSQLNIEFVMTYGYKTGPTWQSGTEKEMAYCGVFAGANYGIISNVSAKSPIKCEYNYSNYNGNETYIQSTLRVGGIAGSNETNDSLISNASFTGNIKSIHTTPGKVLKGATTEIGGITGVNYRGILNQCYVESDKIENSKAPYTVRLGALTGMNDMDAKIKSCHVKSTLVENTNSDNLGSNNIGATLAGSNKGIIQTSFSENSTFKNTYYGEDGDYFALLVGYNEGGSINKTVGVGNVYNSNNGGGFAHLQKAAYNTSSGPIMNSYYLIKDSNVTFVNNEDEGFTDLENEENALSESLWKNKLRFGDAGWILEPGNYPHL